MLEHCIPIPREFARTYREKGYWADITISEMLEFSIKKHRSREALVYGDLRLNYSQLGEKINRLACHFSESGLKPLDRVVIQLHNCPELVYTIFALVKIGIIPIMALPAHRHTEINYFISHSGAAGYIIPDLYRRFDYVKMAGEVKAKQETLKYVFVAGKGENGHISLDRLLEIPVEQKHPRDYLERLRPDPDEVALMLLSGGTTGIPKLIPRTHNDYVYNCRQSGLVAGFEEDTVFLAVLPISHNFTLASPGILAVFNYGGKVVISPGIEEETVFTQIEKERVTVTSAAVPLISRWVNSTALEKYDLSSLKVIQNGGARLAPELRKMIREKFGCIPQEVFGTAEGLLNMTRLDDDDETMNNSSGAPVSPGDETKIVDDNGKELPDGAAGELICRGPYTIRGYYKAPDHNDRSFTPDGFYRTGDIVRKNSRGYLFTEGRKKDLINRGGEKISCDEVENYILSYPKVENVCLVAMPDDAYGEKGCAYIIPKDGETLTFGEVTGYLASLNIAKFKIPERVEVVREFPLSPAGKILKRKLREDITEKLAREKAKKAADRG